MSFPGPNQPPSNGGGNKPNGGNNPFTNPFSRNNDGKNGGSGANGNKSNGPRPFWQSPWLWVVVVALLAVTMFQLFAGAGSQTIDTKDGMQILNGNTVEYATIVDNTQQVKLKLSSDYSATDPDTGRTKNLRQERAVLLHVCAVRGRGQGRAEGRSGQGLDRVHAADQHLDLPAHLTVAVPRSPSACSGS